jgi:hypothetical protein
MAGTCFSRMSLGTSLRFMSLRLVKMIVIVIYLFCGKCGYGGMRFIGSNFFGQELRLVYLVQLTFFLPSSTEKDMKQQYKQVGR